MGKSVVLILWSIESAFSGQRHRVRGVEGGHRAAIAVGPSADASRHAEPRPRIAIAIAVARWWSMFSNAFSATSDRAGFDRATRPSRTMHSSSATDDTASTSTHLPEGARRRPCYYLIQIVEKIDHHSDQFRSSAGAATSMCTDVRGGVSKERPQDIRR